MATIEATATERATAALHRMGVRLTVRFVGRNTDESGWESDHWRVTLSYRGRRMATTYHMGIGYHGAEPTLADVVYSLASDASAADTARDFADFCADFGYDTDSRKAERTYRACLDIAKRWARVFGSDAARVAEIVEGL